MARPAFLASVAPVRFVTGWVQRTIGIPGSQGRTSPSGNSSTAGRRPRGLTRRFYTPIANGSVPPHRLGVVVTGGSKGVGYALAKEFLKHGDRVVIASRDESRVTSAVDELRRSASDAGLNDSESLIFGIYGDVSNVEDVTRIGHFATDVLDGKVDVWINNAGQTGRRARFIELDAQEISSVIQTNLQGALLGCREAERIMREQGGHCFTMDGSGSIGNATPTYAAYGATKRALPQLIKSISKELKDSQVRFHMLSPGMVLTDLLMSGNTDPKTRKIFNILAEEPHTVAENLVPRIRQIALSNTQASKYVRFLTLPKAFFQLVTGFLFGARRNRFFDETSGARVDTAGTYNENGVRTEYTR